MTVASKREQVVRLCALGVAAGGALLLLGALGFQYLGDLPPCPLCLYQRVPHALAIPLALAAFVTARREGASAEGILATAGLVIAIGLGIAVYQVGIEERWWAGPSTCTGLGAGFPASIEDLKSALGEAAIVSCDIVPWSLFGISLAGFNAIFSLALTGLALVPGLVRLKGGKGRDRESQGSPAQTV